jgi:hypothetical protein
VSTERSETNGGLLLEIWEGVDALAFARANCAYVSGLLVGPLIAAILVQSLDR